MKVIEKITKKTSLYAILVLLKQLTDSKTLCEKHSTKITDRAKLGFVLMSVESGLKKEKHKQPQNQESIALLEEMQKWLAETLLHWKNQEWNKIEFDTWTDLIAFFEKQGTNYL